MIPVISLKRYFNTGTAEFLWHSGVFFFTLLTSVILISSCSKEKNEPAVSKFLVINEIMAKNDYTVTDPEGEYDDWIELYNMSASALDLSGFYLSDSKNDLKKWEFPSGTFIEGLGYLIVWADNDMGQDGLHAGFKLSADGERLILSAHDGFVINDVEFGSQYSDLSYSRIPNGTGNFNWTTPTFRGPND